MRRVKYWVYKESRILGPFDKEAVSGPPGLDSGAPGWRSDAKAGLIWSLEAPRADLSRRLAERDPERSPRARRPPALAAPIPPVMSPPRGAPAAPAADEPSPAEASDGPAKTFLSP